MLTRILTRILIKERQREIRQTHREHGNVRTEAEIGAMWPQAQECYPQNMGKAWNGFLESL